MKPQDFSSPRLPLRLYALQGAPRLRVSLAPPRHLPHGYLIAWPEKRYFPGVIPQKLKIEPFTEGDEWEGLPSVSILVGPAGSTPAPPATPLATVTMSFRQTGAGQSSIVVLSSANPGEIEITSAEDWTFSVPEQIVPGLTAGKWSWRIRLTDTSTTGRPKTYLSDELTVLETV